MKVLPRSEITAEIKTKNTNDRIAPILTADTAELASWLVWMVAG